eukprot:3830290-Pleurochrysis_carterae.AAC.1
MHYGVRPERGRRATGHQVRLRKLHDRSDCPLGNPVKLVGVRWARGCVNTVTREQLREFAGKELSRIVA